MTYLAPPSTPDGCNARKLGAKCDNCPLNNRPAIKPILNRSATLVLLGEAPGYQEEAAQRFFIGRSGKLLDRTLSMFSLHRTSMHITNALLCRPARSLSPKEWRQALLCCRPRLHKELFKVQTRFILAMGGRALLSLTGRAKIFPWIGAPILGIKSNKKTDIDFSDWTILPTIHPAACLRSPAYTPVMQIHLARAWALATGKMGKWRWPKFHLEPDLDALSALKRIKKARLPVGFDIETMGLNPLENKIMCLGLSNGKDTVSVPWHQYTTRKHGDVPGLEEYPYGPAIAEEIAAILHSPDIPKVMQNGSHDILGIKHQGGLDVQGYIFDTMLAHAVVAPRIQHDLGFIATVDFHAPRWKTEFHVESDTKGSEVFSEREPLHLRLYNAKDAYMTLRLMKPLQYRLDQTHRGNGLFTRYITLTKHAMEMTERGVLVDTSRFDRHRQVFMRRKAEALRDLRNVAVRMKCKGGAELNPNSKRHLWELFFKRLRVQPKFFSEKTGDPQLHEKMLKELLSHGNVLVNASARLLLRYRRWNKLLSTYIDGLPIDSQNIIHPTWKVHGARTGRWGCFLMTIPKPQVETLKSGKKRVIAPGLRDLFVARPGYVFWQADYSQLELRIIALLAGDEKLIAAYKAGKDVHSENARDIFQLNRDPTKDERNMAKVAVYLMNYGGDVQSLWRGIIVDFPQFTIRQAHWIYRNWFQQHYDIHRWQQNQLRICREKAYVEVPLSGRRQYYQDGIVDRNEILNFPVQGTGADIIDPALIRAKKQLRGYVLLQVHDALGGESKFEDMKHDYRVLKEAMEVPVTLNGHTMKMKVDISGGLSWGEQVDWQSEKELDQCLQSLQSL